MFQFPGFASTVYVFNGRYRRSGGLPHSEIHGSKPARGSPWLIATCCVLHRLSVPRHPPDALQTLDLDSISPNATRRGKPARGRSSRRCITTQPTADLFQGDGPVGSSLVTYPLHDVNRSRIRTPKARGHKPLPSRNPSPRLPGRRCCLMRRDAEAAARRIRGSRPGPEASLERR